MGGFCPIAWGMGALSQPISINFDLQKYNVLAEKFTKNEILLDYIKNILAKSEFQENPKKYLENWREQRGNSEQYLFPQDDAMRFFHTHFGR